MKITAAGLFLVTSVILGGGALIVSHQGTDDTSVFNTEAKAAKSSPDLANPKVLGWSDLLPDGESDFAPPQVDLDFLHMQSSPFPSSETGRMSGPMAMMMMPAPAASGRQDLADTAVKLAGYMTPLNVEQGKTSTFLLVPYVGACIHVPAPPANQIVLVETKEPVEVREMWEPFEAIGTLRVESMSTGLAEVSYTMDLDRIEAYADEQNLVR
ncbi:DUF3299 domain-containing protein [Ahrensia sp. R2A130]|uniref:DUF3299 domain-containing protein n=1 Tax=Ahrensia sp. R2A130 TaxID=744979 RepID=UPI0001E0E914|nr:DUF3299 domain-containing protein [Ahrensia sp. R2A130]EFL87483.1 lipoprotein [Ahrensia sp. R2A130]